MPVYRLFAKGQTIGSHNVPLQGGLVLAANHSSFLDTMCLVAEMPRQIRFITLDEIIAQPVLGKFVHGMTAIPVSREQSTARAVLPLVRALRAGEVVGVFPEAGIRPLSTSVLTGGGFQPGIARLSLLGRAPILPVAVLDAARFHAVSAWLPLKRTPYLVAFGEPLWPRCDLLDPVQELNQRLSQSFQTLYQQALTKSGYVSQMK